ncbi:MAG: type 1 glutamine amidotransferase domain-containing protein [Solirubrobacterales bacterium]|nr:type 1 glutamine amidotransferase domain-containing protein [Solirubrobacterales bacterium]
MTKVLMVLTGADTWTMKDGTPHPTGFWLEEFVRPHKTFTEAGFDVSIATPQGRTPTVDPLSLDLSYNHNDQSEVDSLKAYLDALTAELSNTLVLGDVDPADYDVMFVVGGHGPMQDLAVDPDIGALMGSILDDDTKVLAAVCHGPASFLSAHDADGKWLFKGRRLTGFSNEEETMATFSGNAPWLLQDRLRLAGAIYEEGPAYEPHAVTDGNLVTGQQNYSAQATADAVMKALGSRVPA